MPEAPTDRPALVAIDADGGPWMLHDAAATRMLETAALAHAAPHALMLRAGLSVARLALAVAPHAQQVTVWAGPGNNGGDALVAALHLHRAGRRLRVHLFADPGRLPPDAMQALQSARAAGVPIELGTAPRHDTDLVIDGLLGLGTSRAPEGQIAEAIRQINVTPAPVLAIDLPSGLNADTGNVHDAMAVQASTTLSLLTLKPGLFTGAGRDHAGAVWFDALGADQPMAQRAAPCARIAGPSDLQAAFAPRPHASHKGSFGDVAVVGGAPGMQGAASLAACAALAAGAGRMYLSPLDTEAAPSLDRRPELMCRPAWWRSSPAVLAGATVVCGCGGGSAVREALPALLSHAARLVLDADALNAIAGDSTLQRLLEGRAGRGHATVLTPHPLEAARLLGWNTGEVQARRVAAACKLAEQHQCVVVLKGSGSVIATPGELPSINISGNASLASAGTGDVLAGWLGGLWAAKAHTLSAGDAARAAVWLHGHAADRAWAHTGHSLPLRAIDLIEGMRLAVPRLP
jgi:ADP-dependent NAD(P)H-hydrate dehydratase / NAD(P)H-hydrate epimerase